MKLTWTGLQRSEDWFRQYKRRIPAAMNKITLQEANLLRAMMVKGLVSQSPGGEKIKPIKASTRMLRALPKSGKTKRKGPAKSAKLGSSKALIHRGDLLRSIHTKKHTGSSYTSGVHRGTRGNKSGKDMKNIAEIHEGGTKKYTVTVTEKMRKFSIFLFMMGVILAPWKVGQKLKRKIPARPFLEPAHDQWEPGASHRFSKNIEFLVNSF
jgi:hypothetical protein